MALRIRLTTGVHCWREAYPGFELPFGETNQLHEEDPSFGGDADHRRKSQGFSTQADAAEDARPGWDCVAQERQLMGA